MIEKGPGLAMPLISLVLSALFVALNVNDLPEWLGLFTIMLAVLFSVFGLFATVDWLTHALAERMREVNTARTWGAVTLAQALRGLTTGQTEAIMAGEKVALELMPTDDEPLIQVRGLTRHIPWHFVQEFLEKSQMTAPYLYPIREAGNEAYATDLTNLIVARGWADKAAGPFSAKLKKPLSWVAKRFWVDLSADLEESVDEP